MTIVNVGQFCLSAKLYHQTTEQRISSDSESLQLIFSILPIFFFNSMTYPTLTDVLSCLYVMHMV